MTQVEILKLGVELAAGALANLHCEARVTQGPFGFESHGIEETIMHCMQAVANSAENIGIEITEEL